MQRNLMSPTRNRAGGRLEAKTREARSLISFVNSRSSPHQSLSLSPFLPYFPPPAMDPLFSGSVARQRQINLGGTLAGPSSTTQLASQARQAREARNLLRKSHEAATVVQKTWRSAKVRNDLRRAFRQKFERLATEYAYQLNQDPEQAQDLAFRTTLALTTGICIYRRRKNTATNIRTKDSPAEDELLRQWCQTLSNTTPDSPHPPLYAVAQRSTSAVYYLSCEVEWRLKYHAAILSQDTKTTYLVFLNTLWSSSALTKPLAVTLFHPGQYQSVSAVIATFPIQREQLAPTLAEAAANALCAPFTLFQDDTHKQQRLQCVEAVGDRIMQMPSFRSLSPTLLGRIVAKLPVLELAQHYINTTRVAHNLNHNWPLARYNFATLCTPMLGRWNDPKEIELHLDALAALEAAAAASPSAKADNSSLCQFLPNCLRTALAASAKWPTATTPALHRYVLTLLAVADPSTATQIANAVTYGAGQAGSVAHTHAGHIRELWRGSVRSSALTRALLQVSSDAEDTSFLSVKGDWHALLLFCELYSRYLTYLADDEFMPPRQGGIASSTNSRPGTGSASKRSSSTVAIRNPLSPDEVIELSQIARNLAFVCYWQIDPPTKDEGRQVRSRPTTDDCPPSVIYTWSRVRDLSTRLTQQLQSRDARHRFTPDDFWTITAGLDITKYMKWILEEDERIAEAARAGDVPAHIQSPAEDYMEEDDEEHSMAAVWRSSKPSTKVRRTTNQAAVASPRLGILNNLPFVIPFHTRVRVFDEFISRDAQRLGLAHEFNSIGGPVISATIRRDHVAEDGMEQLNPHRSGLKHRVFVKFIDQFGIPERGVDGGGLYKEFLTSLAKEAFDTDRGLWRANERQELYPNPAAYARLPEHNEWYTFLGRVVGKGLYDGILVDLRFAPFFLSKLLGREQRHFTDEFALLDSLDPELYRGLVYLKNYSGDVEEDFSLNFTITDDELGERKVTELMRDGANVAVTNANRIDYIHRVARYRLDHQIRRQSEAFLSGLSDIINPRWLRLFDQVELQELIKGADSPIDIDDLRKNVILSAYHPEDLTIQYFWQAMESFDEETKSAVLKFVTSCPSPPLLGFGALNPKICIRLAGEDEQRLPTASTCTNLLHLPRYQSLDVTRSRLLTAVKSESGFAME